MKIVEAKNAIMTASQTKQQIMPMEFDLEQEEVEVSSPPKGT